MKQAHDYGSPATRLRAAVPVWLLLMTGCILRLGAVAQVGTLNLMNAPVSPDAASLGRFVEVPVGYYSGLPQIGIPLYTLDVREVAIPISLGYDASGIKVKNIPGQVGTGWSLNAGGLITRVVRGYPDDHDPFVTPYDGDDYYDSINRRTARAAANIGYNQGLENAFSQGDRYPMLLSTPGVTAEVEYNLSMQQYYNYMNRRMDTEIDLYYFNFLGNSGRFTFTNEGEPMLLSGTNGYKIDYIDRKFKITDAGGVEYYFDSTEQALDEGTNVGYYSGGSRMYTTSWYLSKIYIPVHQQTITFSYRRFWNYDLYRHNFHVDYYQAFQSRTDRLKWYEGTYRNFNGYFMESGCPPYDRVYASSAPHSYANTLFISEINWNGNTIHFYGDTNRTDLYRYKLDSIKVISNNRLHSTIRFGYSYFNAASGDAGSRRLKLTDVRIDDRHYQMGYIDTLHGLGMPRITSTGQDIWGYYNGEDDENTIPYYKLFSTWPDPNLFFYIHDARSTPKNSDYRYGQLGTLSSITYPTGGQALFEYEGNDYSKVGFLHPDSTIESDKYTQIKLDSLGGKGTSAYTIPGHTPDWAEKKREFIVHTEQTSVLYLLLGMQSYDMSYDTYMDSIYDQRAEAHAYLQKYNDVSGQFETIRSYTVMPVDSIGHPSNEWDYDQLKYKSMWNGTDTVFLPEGRYRVMSEVYGWYMQGDIGVSVKFPYKRSPGIYNAGGLRIRKIQFTGNTDTDTSFVKQYEYSTGGLSSGVLESPFANITTSFYYGGFHSKQESQFITLEIQEACGFIDFQSDPVIPLGNAQGGVIGYAHVKEAREDGSATAYHYTNGTYGQASFADVFVTSQVLPTRSRILIDHSGKRGLLKQTDFFDSGGNLVRQVFSDYDYQDNQLYQQSVSMLLDDVKLYVGGPYSVFGGYSKNEHYYTRVNSHSLKKEDSVVTYSPGGNITEVTRYTYRSHAWPHVYPVTISKKNSLGEQVVTQMKYPQDYPYLGAAPTNPKAKGIKNLLGHHIISPVIETYVQKKNADGTNPRAIAGRYVSYHEAMPLPDSVFDLQTAGGISGYQDVKIDSVTGFRDAAYSPVLLFPRYDAYGNVAEQLKNNDVSQAIIWGYNHMYPVARITGADYHTAINLIDTNIINNPASDGQLLAELDKIRTHFATSAVSVASYAYAPLTGMTAQVDPAGRTIFYEYDFLGRLKLIKDQDGNILKRICYNYAGQPENCDYYESDAIDDDYYSQNCSPGQSASAYHVTVPKGMFISYTDQQTANQLAQQYAQNEADQNGLCTDLDIELYYENHHGTDATIKFHDLISGQDYWFLAVANSNDILGSVPPGAYDITITPDNPAGWYYYSAGCGFFGDGPGAFLFHGVDINYECDSIMID